MELTPDGLIYWQWKWVSINATLVFTWVVMGILTVGSWLATRNLSAHTRLSRWQNFLESLVSVINNQIREVTQQEGIGYLPFIGTLFLLIAVSNLLTVVPGFYSPAGSLSTTGALAFLVFIAVPIYGIAQQGLTGYFRQYIQPTPLMLPFNIIGELSRTLALAVRLFGNVMSGTMIAAILLAIAPLFFPILMQLLGLLTGLIQAYIFTILALVYIASATQVHEKQKTQYSTEH